MISMLQAMGLSVHQKWRFQVTQNFELFFFRGGVHTNMVRLLKIISFFFFRGGVHTWELF